MDTKTNRIIIAGPTASGKTNLALEIASRVDSQIICADSRTVYIGLDIGTAKPSLEEREQVPHHCIDLCTPDVSYSVFKFLNDASVAEKSIISDQSMPIIVGGSGMYIDACVYNYELGNPPDLELRSRLNNMSVDQLRQEISEKGLMMPKNQHNHRHLVRAIENMGIVDKKTSLPSGTRYFALDVGREELRISIKERASKIFKSGVIEEWLAAVQKYGQDAPGLKAPAYLSLLTNYQHGIDIEVLIDGMARRDWQLARRQMTWLRRNRDVVWLKPEVAVNRIMSTIK